jgi:hypothetical protein
MPVYHVTVQIETMPGHPERGSFTLVGAGR